MCKELFCSESSAATDKVVDFRSLSLAGVLNLEQDSLTCEVVINLPKDFYAVRLKVYSNIVSK